MLRDGMGPAHGDCPWQRGARAPCPPRHPDPSEEGKEPVGGSAQRLQDRWAPCKTATQADQGGWPWLEGPSPALGVGWTRHPGPLGGGLGAPLHPSAERVQLPARRSWEPFPQAHCRHLPGGAAHAGRGHFQPNVLLCFLHGKKLFPLLSGKLLAIIRQAGGKDSYPSNNAI